MGFMNRLARVAVLLALGLVPVITPAKPIAFAGGTTLMAEYAAGSMEEIQVFHAPKYFYSIGPGYLSVRNEERQETHSILYARANFLAKRWNLNDAQGNVFLWGGAGSTHVSRRPGDLFTWTAGGQIDYETRRIYSSLKSELYDSSAFSHRSDTLQLGVAPYEHDYDKIATWLVVQARRYAGDMSGDTEWALLLRLFTSRAWIEAGANTDGKLQAMLMYNF
jgi:hypothetical protein